MNEQPTHLDLFSGIGGFALAAGWAGFKTIGFCDNEPYAQAVLKKHWPEVPIHKDIKELRGEAYRGCTLLTGGFPCQPFSHAGKRRGKDDDRHLWPEMLRVIEEAQPTWVIGENVAGIINMELDKVCSDLETKGYEVWPLVIPACGVDAPHKRDRVWIVANANHDRPSNQFRAGIISESEKPTVGRDGRDVSNTDNKGLEGGIQRCISRKETEMAFTGRSEDVANATSERRPGSRPCGEWGGFTENRERKTSDVEPNSQHCEWLTEPELGRVANGIPNRSHRLKGLGNAIVPQIAYQIIKGIRELL